MPEDFGESFSFPKPEGAFFGGRRPADFVPTYPPARCERERELEREAKERKLSEIARLIAEEGLTRAEAKAALREARRAERAKAEALAERRAARAAEAAALRLSPVEDAHASDHEVEDQASFVLQPPPVLEGGTLAPGAESARVHYRRLLDEATARLQAERAAAGKTFLGVDRILSQDPFASSGSTVATYESIPRALADDEELNKEVQDGFWRWQEAYREARQAWPEKRLDFPPGTQVMVHRHAARRMPRSEALRRGLLPSTGPPRAA